jgi:hypothetical protein
MRVTLDSNVWEKVFDPDDRDWASVRSAIASRQITGFICEAAFRIEAIRKCARSALFCRAGDGRAISVFHRHEGR